MFSLTYLFVPLYKIFCQAVGVGGYNPEINDFISLYQTGNLFATYDSNTIVPYVNISFQTHIHDNLPLLFFSENSYLKVPIGKSVLIFFNLVNFSDETILFSSTYNVIPAQVNSYFNKIQCFCFEDQIIEPKQSVELPVFFCIDPSYVKDLNVSNITNIILSYSIFKITI